VAEQPNLRRLASEAIASHLDYHFSPWDLPMDIYRDIPYILEPSQNPLHQFDLYLPQHPAGNLATRPLICFVHGGAWRS
jgi:acetyl esterase/lipase